jgi:hypothetical protein
MTTLASAIVGKASILLLDVANIRWSQAELLSYLCDGQREAASLKPNIYTKFAPVTLVPGARQSMPADAKELKSISRNVNGVAVRPVNRDLMDAHMANWYTAKASATVQHSMYALSDPLTFFVYPPQPATLNGSVEMTYYAVPADVTLTAAILIPDTYAPALLDYILYRAFSKDTEFAANLEVAQSHLTAFVESLTGKSTVEKLS